ncbi:hypothetical protein JNUCC0626_13470 [Lentzea sp. JNUCC 0626]|uniref:hypothetical protein n=1 Tax=Lentzea sp. JNUCC 0626 TaxID=3367513 RepID=UPI003749A247
MQGQQRFGDVPSGDRLVLRKEPPQGDCTTTQAIGISTDEFARAKDSDVRNLRNVIRLIDLGWARARCVDYLVEHGFGSTAKSACIGCPFHSNVGWRWLRDNDPVAWASAVELDNAIRNGYSRATSHRQELHGRYFLHRSCKPLDKVELDAPSRGKRRLQLVTTDPAQRGLRPATIDISAKEFARAKGSAACYPYNVFPPIDHSRGHPRCQRVRQSGDVVRTVVPHLVESGRWFDRSGSIERRSR